MRLTRWLIFAIAASLLVLAACGDDDSGGNGAPAATDVVSDAAADDSADEDGDVDDRVSAFDFLVFTALAGEWSGTWNNDTFGSTAAITMSIAVNVDGTASFSFDLPAADTGAPFGLSAVGPQAFEGTYDESGLRVAVTGDALFGDVTVTITPDGQLTASATMDGALGIDGLTVEGTFTGDGLDVTYTVTFPDGPDATGSATLTKS